MAELKVNEGEKRRAGRGKKQNMSSELKKKARQHWKTPLEQDWDDSLGY